MEPKRYKTKATASRVDERISANISIIQCSLGRNSHGSLSGFLICGRLCHDSPVRSFDHNGASNREYKIQNIPSR